MFQTVGGATALACLMTAAWLLQTAFCLCTNDSTSRVCDLAGVLTQDQKTSLGESMKGLETGDPSVCPCGDACTQRYPMGVILIPKASLPQGESVMDLDRVTSDLRDTWWKTRNCSDHITVALVPESMRLQTYLGNKTRRFISRGCILRTHNVVEERMHQQGAYEGLIYMLKIYREAVRQKDNFCFRRRSRGKPHLLAARGINFESKITNITFEWPDAPRRDTGLLVVKIIFGVVAGALLLLIIILWCRYGCTNCRSNPQYGLFYIGILH